MPTHNDPDDLLGSHGPEEVDASQGFEQSDVRVTGIVVFLSSLAIFVVVTAVLCYGIGKVINAHLDRQDGPDTKWTVSEDKQIRQLGNLPNNPALQKKVQDLTESFPTPRLLIDDGNEDVAELHQREDLLLENYSWADAAHTKVRIPIERAMELIAERGLPVAPAAQLEKPMTADKEPGVTVPLTNGFARTGYELDQAKTESEEAKRPQ
jgi:hypothetical protein